MSVFKMAWRNVWRNRRRSIVTIGAMTLAFGGLILYAGLIEWYIQSMEDNIVQLEMGDVQIFADGYRDKPSLYDRIDNPESLLKQLDAQGYAATPRLLGTGLAAGEDTSAGAMLQGIDVERDAKVSLVHESVYQGAWLDAGDLKGVVLGKRLARTLNVQPGGEILILSQAADGSMANDVYQVRGVLKSISERTDRAGVFLTAVAYRELMVVPDGVHQIIVRRPDAVPLPAAGEAVAAIAQGTDVKTWKQLVPTLANLLETQRGAVMIMFLVIYVAIGIVLLNTVLMSVFERIREFGVLKAVGMGPFMVFRLVYAETAVMTFIAVIAGVILSTPFAWYWTEFGLNVMGDDMALMGTALDATWRVTMNANAYTGPLFTLVFIVVAAAFYPAVKAARLQPVAAIHHRD